MSELLFNAWWIRAPKPIILATAQDTSELVKPNSNGIRRFFFFFEKRRSQLLRFYLQKTSELPRLIFTYKNGKRGTFTFWHLTYDPEDPPTEARPGRRLRTPAAGFGQESGANLRWPQCPGPQLLALALREPLHRAWRGAALLNRVAVAVDTPGGWDWAQGWGRGSWRAMLRGRRASAWLTYLAHWCPCMWWSAGQWTWCAYSEVLAMSPF